MGPAVNIKGTLLLCYTASEMLPEGQRKARSHSQRKHACHRLKRKGDLGPSGTSPTVHLEAASECCEGISAHLEKTLAIWDGGATGISPVEKMWVCHGVRQ